MPERFDVIIIGGGLAGLVCGAKLSHDGFKILLLEQNNVPGGCATTFRHKDFNIEVGLHEMDGFNGGNLKNKIFSELHVFDHVDFIPTDIFFRFVHKDTDLTVPHDCKKAIELFTAKFPSQAEGINLYFDRLINNRKYRSDGTRPQISLGAYLDSIISDNELKLALTGNLIAFSDDPYNISLDYFAQAQGTFHLSSGVFIKKGSQQLSNYFMNYILNHDGTVKLKHRADKIITRNNRAVGVEYHPVSETSSKIFAESNYVVANTSVMNVSGEMISQPEMKKHYEEYEIGPSMFTLYICFNTPLKELGNSAYCTCFFPDEITNLGDVARTNRQGFENKYFVLTDYSQIDSGLAPEGKSFAVIVCSDYASNWKHLSKEAYKKEKERVSRLFITRVEHYFSGITKNIEYFDAATPLTIERYTANPGGAIYGFAQSPRKAANTSISKFIDNLFLASAWDKFGGGFSAVIYSGYFTGIDILRHSRGTKQGRE